MSRRPDVVRVEAAGASFDGFSSLTIVNDIAGQTEAVFEIGDASAWEALNAIVAPGQEFAVYLNDRLRMKGRAEVNEAPITPGEGHKLSLVCRTKLADARYCSANPATRVAKASLKDFVLALYEPLGIFEGDFLFAEATARDVMTGKGGGGKPPVDLAPIQLQQAKVNPPETIYECAERHLKRHHLTHWDAPDGRVLVGVPDDTQAPLYRAICRRTGAAAQANNVVGVARLRDWSEVPGDISVFGTSPGRDIAKSTLRGTAVDLDLARVFAETGHFYRPVIIPSEQVKTLDQADAQAQREMSARSRRKDAWQFTFDGWTYWDGNESIPWAHNTTIDVDVETVAAGARGTYLIHRVELKLSTAGPTTTVTAVAPGIWAI